MPDEPNATQTDTSSGAPGGTASSPPEWRAGADAPTWAQGKTAAEILGLATQRENYLMSAYQQAAQAAQVQQQAPAPAGTPIADDDYLTGRQLKEVLAQAGQNVGGALSGAFTQTAQLALTIVKDRHRKDFDKYGPEILSKIQALPPQLQTLDNLETMVKLVRSDHVEDLATEKARELAASQNLTLRSNGGGGFSGTGSGGHPFESDKLSADWKARLDKVGVTSSVAEGFCRANGITMKQFLEDAEKMGQSMIVDRGRDLR